MEYCCHFPCGSVDWNLLLNSGMVRCRVTSLVEVWIEISLSCKYWPDQHVTSLVEVWIEIFFGSASGSGVSVTSLVEVWIEILLMRSGMTLERPSLPLWKCGLKWSNSRSLGANTPSLPLWKCGLKWWKCRPRRLWSLVTSLVEVWIEISAGSPVLTLVSVTSLVEVWIEIE